MKKAIFYLIPFLFISLISVSARDQVIVNISKRRVINDVYVLASDSLRGRQFPDIGREKAAAYIAEQFAWAGLKGISERYEPYYQKIPVTKIDRGRTVIYKNDKAKRSGNGFSFAATKALNDSLSIPVKFIGYSSVDMISYSGKDTLIFFLADDMVDAHNRLDALIDASGAKYYGFSIYENSTTFPWQLTDEVSDFIIKERIISNYQYPETIFRSRDFSETNWLFDYLPLKEEDFGLFLFNNDLLEKFFKKSPKDLHRQSRRSLGKGILPETLNKQLTFATTFSLFEISGYDDNVIGYIEGTDLKDEYIIICGHYDHLGKSGDNIYYGADDNASGTAAVMELARAFSQAQENGVEFRRSIVFIAFGAEETGLNGSSYYVSNPLFPLDKTVLVINLDMIGRSDQPAGEPGYAYVNTMRGLRRPVRQALRKVDKKIDNIQLQQPQFFRSLLWYAGSDHFPFVRKGVPAVVINTGTHPDYHKPTDTPDKINYDNLVNIIRVVFMVATKVTNEPLQFPLK